MKAIICTQYGSPEVLQLREVAKPVPKSNGVLIKISATAVTASDCMIRSFQFRFWPPLRLMIGLIGGIKKPRKPILGSVFAGEIEATGAGVKQFQTGDQVYGMTMLRFGTYMEYKCLPEKSVITLKPSNLTDEQAAAIPYGGIIFFYFFFKTKILKGEKMLIYCALGAISNAAIKLAKKF